MVWGEGVGGRDKLRSAAAAAAAADDDDDDDDNDGDGDACVTISLNSTAFLVRASPPSIPSELR